MNELVESVTEVTTEVINEKVKKKESKHKDAATKIAKKIRESVAKEEKSLEQVLILTAHVDECDKKSREACCSTLLKEIKKDKIIKATVLRDILNDY